MKKITALLLTAVLLVSTIQPVCAAYPTDSMQPKIPTESNGTQSANPHENDSISSVTPDQAAKTLLRRQRTSRLNLCQTKTDHMTKHITLLALVATPAPQLTLVIMQAAAPLPYLSPVPTQIY